MISESKLISVIYDLIKDGQCVLPKRTEVALKEACNKEKDQIARIHLETTIRHLRISKKRMIPLCADTGYPVFYIRLGCKIPIRGGVPSIERAARKAIQKATVDAWLRPVVVDPLSLENPGTNVGRGSPCFDYKFDPDIEYGEITFAPKGGGTEIFLAPSFRVLLAADGQKGMKRFIFDTIAVLSDRTGGTCTPNIVGIGIGGTSDLCMRLAKQAAVLRPVGDRHPDKRIAEMEIELMSAFNETGIGPLGTGGKTTVLDVHIEYAMGRAEGTPVGIAIQCPATRIAVVRIYRDGTIERRDWPEWFSRNRSDENI
jgi:tartrate/fumarate subfamily iron-sulfur-dependent hydro-lyase alpha chain